MHQRVPVSELLKDYLAKNPKASLTTAANYQGTVSLWIAARGDKPLNGTTRKVAAEWLERSWRANRARPLSGT